MPPQRTFPSVKPVKTERTHEENQERAYIAASRRSDRSLEARVESARRASEIHKRRTGRSLRVTEQDVVNEEMYEEEDDGLPSQYRRLTAHLQTGSADFNRRLAAYLTNHIAMRSALDQAITSSYAQQYPNAPQFVHNRGVFPSPIVAQAPPRPPQPQSQPQPQPQPQSQQQQRTPTSAVHSPHPYRQAPYPMPGTPGYRQHPPRHGNNNGNNGNNTNNTNNNNGNNGNNRSASISVSDDGARHPPSHSLGGSPVLHSAGGQAHPRRMSMPAATAIKPADVEAPTQQLASRDDAEAPFGLQGPPMGPPCAGTRQAPSRLPDFPWPPYDLGPLTTSLPLDSQLLLGSTLDPNDPFTTALMAGSEAFGPPYDFGDSVLGPASFRPSYGGMNATLAPSALDVNALPPPPPPLPAPARSIGDLANAVSASYFDFGLYGTNDLKGPNATSGVVGFGDPGSACATPGIDGSWDTFINDGSWVENAT